MPMIDLTLPEGALRDDAKGRLVEELTTALLKWEGAPDNEVARSLAWTYVDERPAGAINVAGAPAQEPRYRVKVTVPEGALDDERKAGLVAEVTERVLAAEGRPNEPAHAARVWCIVREVRDGNWGGGGRIARLKDIAQLIGATPDSVREAKRELVGERP
jgi:phenylpyruvate tautomerase PptA (4-oxalocrotonate tautomerase family)